ncbi:hypothetical protein LTR17_014671 [Elasticomyces elasticus]|nr:hypothetical protein LTR17_014671 [Elasticomyces elasticus]
MELGERIAVSVLCCLVVPAVLLFVFRIAYDWTGPKQLEEEEFTAARPETELQRLAKREIAILQADRERMEREMASQRIELEKRRRLLRIKWAEFGKGSESCFVYNYGDGDGSTGWSPASGYWLTCDQHNLGAGKGKGGSSEGVDVDGITYDRKWTIIWQNGHREELGPRQWAKISSGEWATCTAANGVTPVCRVKCNTPFNKECIGA